MLSPQTSRFGDLVHLNTDRLPDPLAAGVERYVGLEHIEPENLHIRSWGNVADGITFTNHFKPGQVLFGKRRAYQRKVAVAEFEGVCSSDIYVFESKDPDVLLPELKETLKSLIEAVAALLQHLPEDKATETTEDIDKLVDEATKSKPNPKWYSVSIEGLSKAAENLDKLGEPVINLSRKVLSLLTGGVIK